MSGRAATLKVQKGDFALSVGNPKDQAPDGWKWTELLSVAEMASGHTPSRRKPEYWKDGDIKWMCAADARFQHGGVVSETKEKINQLGLDNSAAVLLPKDTVCLSRTGASIGYAVRLGESMATNQGFFNWICSDDLNPKYLQYALMSEINFLERIAYGAAHHTIYFPELKAFHICMPNRKAQDRIVDSIDKAFAAIDQAKSNVEKNIQNAKELFQSTLNEIFSQKGDGWEEVVLKDIIDVKHGFAFKSKFFATDGEFVLLTPGNYFEEGGYRDRGAKQKYYQGEIPAGYILEKDDLLVAMTEQAAGLLGSPLLVPESNKFLHNQRLGLIKIKAGVRLGNRFLYHVFNTRKLRKEIHYTGTGLKVRHTSPTKISAIRVCVNFNQDVQEKTIKLLKKLELSTDEIISKYYFKLSNLEDLKKSILQKAFTGELTAKNLMI